MWTQWLIAVVSTGAIALPLANAACPPEKTAGNLKIILDAQVIKVNQRPQVSDFTVLRDASGAETLVPNPAGTRDVFAGGFADFSELVSHSGTKQYALELGFTKSEKGVGIPSIERMNQGLRSDGEPTLQIRAYERGKNPELETDFTKTFRPFADEQEGSVPKSDSKFRFTEADMVQSLADGKILIGANGRELYHDLAIHMVAWKSLTAEERRGLIARAKDIVALSKRLDPKDYPSFYRNVIKEFAKKIDDYTGFKTEAMLKKGIQTIEKANTYSPLYRAVPLKQDLQSLKITLRPESTDDYTVTLKPDGGTLLIPRLGGTPDLFTGGYQKFKQIVTGKISAPIAEALGFKKTSTWVETPSIERMNQAFRLDDGPPFELQGYQRGADRNLDTEFTRKFNSFAEKTNDPSEYTEAEFVQALASGKVLIGATGRSLEHDLGNHVIGWKNFTGAERQALIERAREIIATAQRLDPKDYPAFFEGIVKSFAIKVDEYTAYKTDAAIDPTPARIKQANSSNPTNNPKYVPQFLKSSDIKLREEPTRDFTPIEKSDGSSIIVPKSGGTPDPVYQEFNALITNEGSASITANLGFKKTSTWIEIPSIERMNQAFRQDTEPRLQLKSFERGKTQGLDTPFTRKFNGFAEKPTDSYHFTEPEFVQAVARQEILIGAGGQARSHDLIAHVVGWKNLTAAERRSLIERARDLVEIGKRVEPKDSQKFFDLIRVFALNSDLFSNSQTKNSFVIPWRHDMRELLDNYQINVTLPPRKKTIVIPAINSRNP